MKDFVNCPKCHGVLKHDYAFIGPNEEVLIRTCEQVSHYFKCVSDSQTNELQRVTIRISTSPLIKVSWNIEDKKIIVNKGTLQEALSNDGGEMQLPFFEPDFSDYNKLISKIKTYLIFS